MKLLLDIKDDKAAFVIELLHNFKFVKAKTLTSGNVRILAGLKQAVEEVNQIKAGKEAAQPLNEFLREL